MRSIHRTIAKFRDQYGTPRVVVALKFVEALTAPSETGRLLQMSTIHKTVATPMLNVEWQESSSVCKRVQATSSQQVSYNSKQRRNVFDFHC